MYYNVNSEAYSRNDYAFSAVLRAWGQFSQRERCYAI